MIFQWVAALTTMLDLLLCVEEEVYVEEEIVPCQIEISEDKVCFLDDIFRWENLIGIESVYVKHSYYRIRDCIIVVYKY